MRFRFHAFCTGLMALLIGTASCGAEPDAAVVQSPKPAAGFLTGRVVTIDGSPIANARIWLPPDNRLEEQPIETPIAETRSDGEGRFRLGPLDPKYRRRFPDLLFEADGFAREFRVDTTVFAGAENNLGDVALWPGCRVHGRLLDFDGKPRTNSEGSVNVWRYELCHTVRTVAEWKVTTDHEGRFVTPPIAAGNVEVSFTLPERQIVFAERFIAPNNKATEEQFAPLQLEKDHPLVGLVQDNNGNPLEGVSVDLSPIRASLKTDKDGRFPIRGYGKGSHFQANIEKDGYSFEVKGFGFDKLLKETPNLTMTLTRAGSIEGQAVDATTGQPVAINSVMLCNVVRKSDGTIERRGCRNRTVAPDANGRFRIPYANYTNFVLTIFAKGYHDTEQELLDLNEIKTVDVGSIKLHRKNGEGSAAVGKPGLHGRVTAGGLPVANAWVALWKTRADFNLANTCVQRGRSVPLGAYHEGATLTAADGSYRISPQFQGELYVVVELPGRAATIRGPLQINSNEDQTLEIECEPGGSIAGRVRDFPPNLRGHLWVVLFGRKIFKTEARVNNDGTFRVDNVPPGEYGLKVGHNAFQEPDLPWGDMHAMPESAYETFADPWKSAQVVKVEPGGSVESVDLTLPKSHE